MSIVCRHRVAAVLMATLCGATTLPAQEASAAAESSPAVRTLERTMADRIESDGSVTRRESFRARILTAGGLAQYSQVGVPFLEANQEAKISALRVTKSDGSELDLLASAPTDIAPILPTDLPIYSDLRMLRAAVPSLAIGDQLHFESTVRSTPIAPGQVWLEMEFADKGGVDSQIYELDLPVDFPLTVSVRPGLSALFEEERRDGRWVRRWRVAVEPAPGAGEPATTTAAPKQAVPDIQVTTFRSWEEFGRWWSSLAPPVVDEKVSAKARELTEKIAEPKARLRALHRYVAQEIRYLALPLGIGRYRAREPGEIMSTGLGDCKDKIRLLGSLAESLGIEVDPVLVFVGAKRTFVEEAPSPLQFDHVIARALLGSEELWLDPTAEMVPLGSLPKSSRGRPGVALLRTAKTKKNGKAAGTATELLTTPAQLPQPPSISVEIDGSLDASGFLSAKVRWTVAGDDELFRLVYKYGDEKVRRAALDALRREWNAESKVGAVTTADPNDVDRPFWLEFEVERSRPASIWRKAWEFWMPAPFTALDAPPPGENDAAGAPKLDRLEFRSTAVQRVRARIEFPEGVRVSPPVPMSSQQKFADFRSSYRVEGRTLVVERELTFKAEAIERAEFDALKALAGVISSDYGQEFDIAAAPALAPAERTAAELRSDCWDAIDAARYEDAERLCRSSIAADPVQRDAWNGLGFALMRLNRAAESKAAFEKQIEIDPQHDTAYANLAALAWERGDLQSAERLYRQQIEIAPLVAYAYSHLGRLLYIDGRFDEAESLLRRAAKLEPNDDEILEDLLELEARRGRFDAFAEMLAEHPALGRGLRHFSANLILLTRQEQADWSRLSSWLRGMAADAERVLQLPGDLPPDKEALAAATSLALAWEGLARADAEQGRLPEALALLDAAIDVAHFPSALAGKSEVLRSEGKRADADLLLAIAVELERERPEDTFLMRQLERRVPDTQERLRLASLAREEAWEIRSSSRRIAAAANDQGELWIRFGIDGRPLEAEPADEARVANLISGLKLEPHLRLPAGNKAQFRLKALAYCSQVGDCSLTLEPPGQTWMSMLEQP